MYFRQHHPVIDGTVGPCALFLKFRVQRVKHTVQSAARSAALALAWRSGLWACVSRCCSLMCFSFKEISSRSVSRQLFVCERGRRFAFWGGGQRAERNLGASQRHTEATSPRFSFFFAADITTYPTAQEYWPRSQSLLLRPLCIVVRISKWHFPLMN